MKTKIEEKYSEPTLNISLDTININKQALIFVNSKRAAESVAEKIASKIKDVNLDSLAEKARKALTRPTRQCERLANIIRKGIAFHHAGLAAKQRELIEDNFRNGSIKIICSTPTLAYGIDMPAFRTIIRDLKRYGGRWGMEWIQVIEYHQMAGRAGRPGHEDFGEAICISQTKDDKQNIIDNFIKAPPEQIFSKLAAEPVLRTYILSLISTEFVGSRKELISFFSQTFWAKQYEDMGKLEKIIDKMIGLLQEWEFLKDANDYFKSASEVMNDKLEATKLGQRVAQLYIDPLTANFMITCLRRATQKITDEFSYTHMITSTLEMRPIFRTGVREVSMVEEKIAENESNLLYVPPPMYDMEYDDFLNTIKTAMVLEEWTNELDEHDILEIYNVRPGEFRAKLNEAEWLLNASAEFARLMGFMELIKNIRKTQIRLKHGVKAELLSLIRLRNIGRVRARKMYRNNVKTLADVSKVDTAKLKQLLGEKVAIDIKKQVGKEIEAVKPNKRKGQKNVKDY
ncbi:hypothetical protein GOV08_00370 [Candidatus Woesearchaeota archaeon]|nr:hypothetical protein [Candidatus Woesearchaeota archaeon]